MRKVFTLTQEEATQAIGLKGAEAISNFWKELSEKYHFNPKTIAFKSQTEFEADSTADAPEETKTEVVGIDYNNCIKEYSEVITGSKEADPIAKIKAWEEEFGSIKIADVDDKVGYVKVTTAISQVRNTRTAIEAKRKNLKSIPLELGKMIDGRAKELTDLLEPIETALKAEKERIDEIKEEAKRKKQEEQEKKYNERVIALNAAGMEFSGSGYKLKDLISISTLEIKGMNDKDWGTFIVRVNNLWEEDKQREETERKEKEAAEKAEKIKQVAEQRKSLLESVGFELIVDEYVRENVSTKFGSQKSNISADILGTLDDTSWSNFMAPVNADMKQAAVEQKEAKKAIEDKEKEQQKKEQELQNQKAEQEQLVKNNRTNALSALGFIFNGVKFIRNESFGLRLEAETDCLTLTEADWRLRYDSIVNLSEAMDRELKEKSLEHEEKLAKDAEDKLAKKKEEEEKEAARQEGLKSDKQRLLEYADKIENFAYPESSDDAVMQIVASSVAKLSAIADFVREGVKSL